MQSTGTVSISSYTSNQNKEEWRDRHIIFVEDIVDTGLTNDERVRSIF